MEAKNFRLYNHILILEKVSLLMVWTTPKVSNKNYTVSHPKVLSCRDDLIVAAESENITW